MATALTVLPATMPSTAKAEQASPTGPAQVVLTPELTAGVVQQFPNMDLSARCTYTAVPAGPGASQEGVLASGMVRESDIVPQAQLQHDDEIRSELITDTNLLYLLGSLVCRVPQGDGSVRYLPQHSYDVWGIQGLNQGIVPAPRVSGASFAGTPQHILDALHVSSGTFLPYTPDHFENTHYRVIEYANMANLIGNARGNLPLSNDEIVRFVLSNMHRGEGVPARDQIFVARYNPYAYGSDRVLSFAPNGGRGVGDVMVYDNNDTDPVIGRGNGRRMGHIARGSQIVNLPGPGRLVHPMIEGLDNPIMVYNPQTRRREPFSRGVFVIPRDLYGLPQPDAAPAERVTERVVTVGVERSYQCNDGLDNDGDGRIDLADPGCDNATDGTESPDPLVPQCSDGLDNDHDGLYDMDDPECAANGPQYNNEFGSCPGCEDQQEERVPPVPVTGDARSRYVLGLTVPVLGSNGALHSLVSPGAMLEFGGRLGETDLYLVGQLGYVYGGSQSVRDPNSRTTLANPEDPFALTSIVEAYDSSTAHMIMPGLEMRYRVAPWIQLAAGIIVPVTVYDQERSVDEILQYQDGSVADEEHYTDHDLETSVMGGGCAGVDFVIRDRVSLNFRGCVAGNQDDVVYGGTAGLNFYFGGGNNPDEE